MSDAIKYEAGDMLIPKKKVKVSILLYNAVNWNALELGATIMRWRTLLRRLSAVSDAVILYGLYLERQGD